MTPSKFQQAIYDAVKTTPNNLSINAVAGSGKSTTLVNVCTILPPDQTTILCAFNKHIADEIRPKVPQYITVKTLNALGHGIVMNGLGRPKLDAKKTELMFRNLLDMDDSKQRGFFYKNKGLINKIVGLSKATLTVPTGDHWNEHVNKLIDSMGWEAEDLSDEFYSFSYDTFQSCINNKSLIDFDDQLFFPVYYSLNIPQFDNFLIDECLPGYMPILLADGTSKTIKEIVENKLDVKVLSFDTITGKQKACSITKWSQSLNQKPLLKIKVAQRSKRSKTYFVVCTTDHKIWANSKWISAGDLKPGMIVQVETSAHKTHKGKISGTGRQNLAKGMSAKNSSGCMTSVSDGRFKGTRGGNGTGPTLAEQTLQEALGPNWVLNYSIKTNQLRGNEYPSVYKVDIANIENKIAIEVDGNSHHMSDRKIQDTKKEKFLQGLGWTIFRVTNKEAIQHTYDLVERLLEQIDDLDLTCLDLTCLDGVNCPESGMILSIQKTSIQDNYVYDLTVDDCHNFYANGILVHNCQDLNKVQIELVCRSGKRIIACGDPSQAIYGFRGADSDAYNLLSQRINATQLPLSVCYRCSKEVVKAAAVLVPQIESSDFASEGKVTTVKYSDFEEQCKETNFVLCRTTAPLVSGCLAALRQGKRASILGRDISEQLTSLVKKLSNGPMQESANFYTVLKQYESKEYDRLNRTENEVGLQLLQDKVETICVFIEQSKTVQEILSTIDRIFTNTAVGITFATVHKAKGLEAEDVYILEPNLMPHPMARKPWQQQQELNIKYVAITRAKQNLYWVGSKGKSVKA